MPVAIKQPQPIRVRTRLHVSKPIDNCAGRQYRVSDDLWTHIVTISGGYVGCSCGAEGNFEICDHVEVVEEQEKQYRLEAKRRLAYCALFDL